MKQPISALQRGLFWLAMVTGVVFGLAYYIVPEPATKTLGIDAPDLLAMRTIGGFLLAEAVGAGLALRSGQWSEVRIVTYYLITWNILNCLVMAYAVITGAQPPALLPNVVLTAILGFGLAFVAWQRRSK